jgi:hypothetical protein
LQGASSQKVSKNQKNYYIHNSLPKNKKSHFGFLGPLGVNKILLLALLFWHL